MIAKAVRPVFGDLFECVLQFLIAKALTFGEQVPEILKDALNGVDIAWVAVYQQFIAASADIHVQKGFEVFDVLVLNTEQRVQTLRRELQFSKIIQILQIPRTKNVYIGEATKSVKCCQSNMKS